MMIVLRTCILFSCLQPTLCVAAVQGNVEAHDEGGIALDNSEPLGNAAKDRAAFAPAVKHNATKESSLESIGTPIRPNHRVNVHHGRYGQFQEMHYYEPWDDYSSHYQRMISRAAINTVDFIGDAIE